MKDIKERLKQVIELEVFAVNRAKELLKTFEKPYTSSVIAIDYEENCITVKFEEITRHDSPDSDWIILTIDELEMGNEDWYNHLTSKILEKRAIEKKKKDDADYAELQSKLKKFEQLKKELGK